MRALTQHAGAARQRVAGAEQERQYRDRFGAESIFAALLTPVSHCKREYGVLIMPVLSLAGEAEGAVYLPVAVKPCQILNGINRKGRRQAHGGVTAMSL